MRSGLRRERRLERRKTRGACGREVNSSLPPAPEIEPMDRLDEVDWEAEERAARRSVGDAKTYLEWVKLTLKMKRTET